MTECKMIIGDVVQVTKSYFDKTTLKGMVGTITHIYERGWTKNELIDVDFSRKKILFRDSSLACYPGGNCEIKLA